MIVMAGATSVFGTPTSEQIARTQFNETAMIVFFAISLLVGILVSFYAGNRKYERKSVILLITVLSVFIGYISAEIRGNYNFSSDFILYTTISTVLMIGAYFGGKNLKIE